MILSNKDQNMKKNGREVGGGGRGGGGNDFDELANNPNFKIYIYFWCVCRGGGGKGGGSK